MSAVRVLSSPRRIKASHRRRRKVTSGRFVQRYYDPILGRPLSVDPVLPDDNGGHFSRYAWVNNNPYRFTDPDGRDGANFYNYTAHPEYQMAAPDPAAAAAVASFLPVVGTVMAVADAIQAPTAANITIAAISVLPEGAGIAKTMKLVKEADVVAKGAAGGERAGKAFTQAGKAEVKETNAAMHGGQTTCADCGRSTVPAQQSRAGVTPPGNETHVDHIIPQSKGGNGSPDNGQVLCRDCNLQKSDH